MDKGTISFFEVKQCGFYSSKNKEYVYEEGSLDETINNFCNWVRDRDFSQTIPWDVNEYPKRQQIYCKSIAQDDNTKDTLLVLWKRFGDDSGKVSGIAPDAKVGSGSNDSIKIDPKVKGQSAFLGQPMYYWFIPERNVIATVNFSHSSAMTKEVCDYIKRCIDYRIDHPQKKIHENENVDPTTSTPKMRKHISYVSSDGVRTMRFGFHVSTKELNSNKANISRLAQNISHIVVRDTISTQKSDDKDPIFNLWPKINNKKTFTKQIEIIEEVNLTEGEVTDIVKVHKQEYNPLNKWNNIGFREKGSDTTRWFHKYVSREQVQLDPLPEEETYYSANRVLSELLKCRNDLLMQIPFETVNESDTDSFDKVRGKDDAA